MQQHTLSQSLHRARRAETSGLSERGNSSTEPAQPEMGEHVCTTQQMVHRVCQVVVCRIPHQQSLKSRTIRGNGAYDPEGRRDHRDCTPWSSASYPETISRSGSHEYCAHPTRSQRQRRSFSASNGQALQHRTTT